MLGVVAVARLPLQPRLSKASQAATLQMAGCRDSRGLSFSQLAAVGGLRVCSIFFQGNYDTPLEHTPTNPLKNYERNPFIACWQRFRGVFQRCVETTLDFFQRKLYPIKTRYFFGGVTLLDGQDFWVSIVIHENPRSYRTTQVMASGVICHYHYSY